MGKANYRIFVDLRRVIMSSSVIHCDIYKGSKKDEMYLYVPKDIGLKKVPESLLANFGEPKLVISIVLTQAQKLARVDSTTVINALQEQGFYLQLPPTSWVNLWEQD